MKEHPILFNGEMVRAILDGRKTMTRRVIRSTKATEWLLAPGVWSDEYVKHPGNLLLSHCPYGVPGDRLWVRETWRGWFPTDDEGQPVDVSWHIRYRADNYERVCANTGWDEGDLYTSPHDAGLDVEPVKWRPSIFMFRWASRIDLKVTGVRVEQATEPDDTKTYDTGDWVWVVEFKRVAND